MSYNNIVKKTLDPIYKDARFPVVFVTSKLDVAYANDCAKRTYPEICGTSGIAGIIGDKFAEKAIKSLEKGEAVKVASVGVRGIVSVSFLPIGGILDGKCFIVHIEEHKALLDSMYAETSAEYAEDISQAALRRPLTEMASVIKLLSDNDKYMSDARLRTYILSLSDGIQEAMSSVRDLGYALRIIGKRVGKNPQIFPIDACLQNFCESHGFEYKNDTPHGLVSLERGKLEDVLTAICDYMSDKIKGTITLTAAMKNECLSITLRGAKYDHDGESDEKEYIDPVFAEISETAEKLKAQIIWKNKKTTLTVILKMTAALPEEPGSYLHNSDDPIYSEET